MSQYLASVKLETFLTTQGPFQIPGKEDLNLQGDKWITVAFLREEDSPHRTNKYEKLLVMC